MPAVQRHIELEPEPVTAANATTSASVAAVGGVGVTAGATAGAAAGAAAAATAVFPGWALVAEMTSTSEVQLETVLAALSGRGAKIDRKNSEAVAAAVETNEANRQSLTVEPVVT
jgi:hypothetical protein